MWFKTGEECQFQKKGNYYCDGIEEGELTEEMTVALLFPLQMDVKKIKTP